MIKRRFLLVFLISSILGAFGSTLASPPAAEDEDNGEFVIMEVIISPEEPQVAVGETLTLRAEVIAELIEDEAENDEANGDDENGNDNGTPLEVSQDVRWSSSDTSIATVEEGIVTGILPGTVTIEAASEVDESVSDSVTLLVFCHEVRAIEVMPDAPGTTLYNDHPAPCADYRITGFLEVENTLTIEAGVILEFAEGAGIFVSPSGQLRALGTEEDPILFTGEASGAGAWEGIIVGSSSSENLLRYVTLEGAGAGNVRAFGSTIATTINVGEGAQISLEDSSIQQSGGYGLYLHEGAELNGFARNSFSDNGASPVSLTSNALYNLDSDTDYAGDGHGDDYLVMRSSTIRTAQTWPATNLPLRFSGQHSVDTAGANDTVTLEGGAWLEFTENAGLRVSNGALRAVGTEEARIRIGRTSAGYFEALVFSSSNPQNALHYVDIHGGGAGSSRPFSGTIEASVILTDGAQVSIENSRFNEARNYGLYLHEGSSLSSFSNNSFSSNGGSPLNLASNQLGYLDAASDYAGEEANTDSYISVRSSTTTRSQTWPAANLPYRFEGFHTIDTESDTATVTLEGGATIKFTNKAGLRVLNGALSAEGSEEAPITLTGAVRTQGGYWEALVFHTNNPDNLLRYVTIEYGGAGNAQHISRRTEANVIIADDAQVRIEHSHFNNSQGYGLYLRDDATLGSFLENTFSANEGAALSLASRHLGSLDAESNYAGEEANADAYISVRSSTTTRSQTWPAANLPYRFFGFHHINMDSDTDRLTVAPGANFEFAANAGLRVDNGALVAEGADDERITFTGAVRTQTGYWEALVFVSNNPENRLHKVDVSYGGAGSAQHISRRVEANVIVDDNAQLSISESSFNDSGNYGLYLRENARLNEFRENRFEGNSGAPLHLFSSHLAALDGDSLYTVEDGRTNGSSYIDVRATTIGRGEHTWAATNLPYRFFGLHSIDHEEAVVTISEGARLEFSSNAGLGVTNGALRALGTEENPIRFKGAIETPGYWEALVFRSNNPANLLQHIEVAYGGAGSAQHFSRRHEANIVLWGNGQLTLENSIIRDSGDLCIHSDSDTSLSSDNLSTSNCN